MTSGFKVGYHKQCISPNHAVACSHAQNRLYCMLKIRPKYAGSRRCHKYNPIPYHDHKNYINGSFGGRGKKPKVEYMPDYV